MSTLTTDRRIVLVKAAMEQNKPANKHSTLKLIGAVAGASGLGAGTGFLLSKQIKKLKNLNPRYLPIIQKAIGLSLPMVATGAALAAFMKDKKLTAAIKAEAD